MVISQSVLCNTYFNLKKDLSKCFTSQFYQTSMTSVDVIAKLFAIKKLTFSFRLHNHNF